MLLLICGAGAIAGVGGWLLGDQLFFQSASASLPAEEPLFEARYPVSNVTMKQDRETAAPRAPEPAETRPNDMMETARAWLAAPVTLPRAAAIARPEKPSRAFLNDAQIEGIRKRLNLSAAQQKYWPPVEAGLREVTLQIEDYKTRLKKSRDDTFDTDSAAVQRLKTATRALYAQLNGQQKNDITLLVRMAGLGPAFAELTGTKAAKNESEDSR
ncbi:MAG TPA: hypothetical protein VF467_04555 [Afipia sp.]